MDSIHPIERSSNNTGLKAAFDREKVPEGGEKREH